MNTLHAARQFFLEPITHKSGELLTGLSIVSMSHLIKFGNRMTKEAQAKAIEFKILGETSEADEIAKDVTTIQKNLNTINKAYNLAMN